MTEGPIKVRQIAESDPKSQGADGVAGEPRVGQQPVHAVQPLLEDKCGIGQSLGFEQLVDVTRRDALAGGDRVHAQLAVGQVGHDVRLDRTQPGGANAETVRTHGALARGVEGQGGQLVRMAGHELLQPKSNGLRIA